MTIDLMVRFKHSENGKELSRFIANLGKLITESGVEAEFTKRESLTGNEVQLTYSVCSDIVALYNIVDGAIQSVGAKNSQFNGVVHYGEVFYSTKVNDTEPETLLNVLAFNSILMSNIQRKLSQQNARNLINTLDIQEVREDITIMSASTGTDGGSNVTRIF